VFAEDHGDLGFQQGTTCEVLYHEGASQVAMPQPL
jgi:hypothetical protein